jgi:hypothetical protein
LAAGQQPDPSVALEGPNRAYTPVGMADSIAGFD